LDAPENAIQGTRKRAHNYLTLAASARNLSDICSMESTSIELCH